MVLYRIELYRIKMTSNSTDFLCGSCYSNKKCVDGIKGEVKYCISFDVIRLHLT